MRLIVPVAALGHLPGDDRAEIRGRDGQVIATLEKEVEELEPYYTTEATVCFANPSVVTKESRYLLLQVPRSGASEYAAWRLRAE